MITIIESDEDAVEWLNKNYKSVCFWANKFDGELSLSLFNANREELACVVGYTNFSNFKKLLDEKLTVAQFVKLVKKKDLKFDNMVFSVRKPTGFNYVWPGYFILNSTYYTKLNKYILKKFPNIMDVPHIKKEFSAAIANRRNFQEELKTNIENCKYEYSQLKSNLKMAIKDTNNLVAIAPEDIQLLYRLKE